MLLRPLSKVPPMITIGPKRIPIQGIIFDMDGTLTTPYLDFRKMRESIGMDPTSREDILVHLERLPDHERAHKESVLRQFEQDAARNLMQPQPGLSTVLNFLKRFPAVKRAILTRNHRDPVDHLLLQHLSDFDTSFFDHVITRDCVRPVKPHPEAVHHLAKQWQLMDCSSLVLVGDSEEDVECGRRAGVGFTVRLLPEPYQTPHNQADATIENLEQLLDLISVVETE